MTTNYMLKWQGTEPVQCTREHAFVQLWAAKIDGVPECYLKTDNGKKIGTIELNWESFPSDKTVAYDLICHELQLFEADKVCDEVNGLLYCFLYPKNRASMQDTADCHLVKCEFDTCNVELRVTTKVGLRRPGHHYEIGRDVGDDYISELDTHSHKDAVLKFCELCTSQYLRQQMNKTTEAIPDRC